MTTVNKKLYLGIFSHLRDAVRRKCPENWRTNIWFLLHDTVPAQRCAKNNVRTLQPPPYSPDMAAADFYLFPQFKSALMGQHFCASTYIIKNPMEELLYFYKTASMNVSNTFTVLAEVYNCTRGSF